ncbi:MAG: S-methyl-5-thioribose-1-phosphate isomerase [Bacteriovoracaceae bacterium]
MNVNLQSMGLIYNNHKLQILDQRLLPSLEKWVTVTDIDHMVTIIQTLAVRGAPLIGVAAALSFGHFALYNKSDYKDKNELEEIRVKLRNARPTAVNLLWALDRMKNEVPDLNPEKLFNLAVKIFEEDVAMCEQMGVHGSSTIKDGENILTICNTGGLATVGIGTALGVIAKAHQQGKKIHVYFCETRPLLQGGRLTAWELKKLGIPHTLICDSMAATLMKEKKIQRCFVGSDRIARNGDFANKIGTYNLAVLANYHKIPFYTVAPLSTVDYHCENGAQIPIEQRNPKEVRGVEGSFGSVEWAPTNCNVYNPSFDVTPNELLTGIVLNVGVKTIPEFHTFMKATNQH